MFLDGLSTFCKALLPAAGLALLIYLVLFFKELIVVLKSLTKTLDTANADLQKLEAPLATVEEISQTVDEVHAAAKDVAMKAASTISKEVDSLKDKFSKDTNVQDADIVAEASDFSEEEQKDV
jgi:uncharacterized protein YoxC